MDESPSAALNSEYSNQIKDGQQGRVDSSHGTMGADTEAMGHSSMNGGVEEGEQGSLETGGLKNSVKMAQAFSTDATEDDEEERAEGGEGELHSGQQPSTPTATTHEDHGVDPEMVKQGLESKGGKQSPADGAASPEPVPEPVESPEAPESAPAEEGKADSSQPAEAHEPPTSDAGQGTTEPATSDLPTHPSKEEEPNALPSAEPPTSADVEVKPANDVTAPAIEATKAPTPPPSATMTSTLAEEGTHNLESAVTDDGHHASDKEEEGLVSVLPLPTPHPEYPFPCLRGKLRKSSDGRIICSGNWGMSLEDFNKAGGLTSRFEFSCRPPGGVPSLPIDGTYLGFFFMQTPKGPAKYEDTCKLIHTPNAAGGWNISGQGRNKCGAYDISGTLSTAMDLEIFRVFSHLLPPGSSNKSVGNKSGARKSSGGTEKPKLHPQESTSSFSPAHLSKEHTGMSSSASLGDGAMSPISYLTEANSVADGAAPDSPVIAAPPVVPLPPPRTSPARVPEPAAPPTLGSIAGVSSSAPAMVSKAGRVVKIPSKMEEKETVRLDKNMNKCQELLGYMVKHKDSFFFREPVDPVKHHAPNYLEVIKQPRDLSLIKTKLEAGEYLIPEDFANDVRLIFTNAFTYNPDFHHPVHAAAKSLSSMFETKWAALQRFFSGSQTSYLEPSSPVSMQSRPTLGGRKSSLTGGLDGASSRPQRGSSLGGRKRQRTSQSSEGWHDEGWNSSNSAEYGDLLEDGLDGDDTLMLDEYSSTASSFNRSRKSGSGAGAQKPAGRGGALKRQRSTGGGRGGGGGGRGRGGGGGQARKRKTPASPAGGGDQTAELLRRIAALERQTKQQQRNDPDEDEPLTYEEKRNLRMSIEKLPAEKASRVVDIISESTNLSQGEDEEVEIDIDSLDTRTLRRLQEYVSSCLGGGPKRPSTGGGRGRGKKQKANGGGSQYWRANDDEDYYDSDYD